MRMEADRSSGGSDKKDGDLGERSRKAARVPMGPDKDPDLEPPAVDFWEPDGDNLIRKHGVPRTKMYVPRGASC